MKPILFAVLLIPVLIKAQTPVIMPGAGKTVNIFTYGDSNGTFPYSWPVQIRSAVPGSEVFNISKSGKTVGFVNNGDSSLNALLTLDKDLKKAADFAGDRTFDYIVIELGTNDAKAVFDAQQGQVAENYDKLINRIKNSQYRAINKAKIMIISPPSYGSKAEAQAKYAGGRARVEKMSIAFKKIAKKYNCLFVDGFNAPGLDMETMSADGLHMNEAGSKKLVEQVAAMINAKK